LQFFLHSEEETMRIATAILVAGVLALGALPATAQRGDPQMMQQRFEQMQEMRRQMGAGQPPEQRREMRRQHRRMMDEQMGDMGQMRGPGPDASVEERMEFMEQRHEMMMQMMREMLPEEQADD
jgi:uncharacterized membrane protein YccC